MRRSRVGRFALVSLAIGSIWGMLVVVQRSGFDVTVAQASHPSHAQIFRRMHRAYTHHHLHKARHLRRRLHGRYPVRMHKRSQGHLHRPSAKGQVPWFCGGPLPLGVTASYSGNVGGALFKANLRMRACVNGKRVRVRHRRVWGEVTDWGHWVGWDTDGVDHSAPDYSHYGRWLGVRHGKFAFQRTMAFLECLPTPIGCGFPDHAGLTLKLTIHGDGSTR